MKKRRKLYHVTGTNPCIAFRQKRDAIVVARKLNKTVGGKKSKVQTIYAKR